MVIHGYMRKEEGVVYYSKSCIVYGPVIMVIRDKIRNPPFPQTVLIVPKYT